MALDVDGLIDETGSAQMEINFRHGSALNLADQVFSFKRLLRETALQHDVFATFMAKPIEGQPGSSMHIHQSIVDVATGKNIFVDANGVENLRLRYFIGGMQTYTNAAMALYAPNVNSYRRFVREFAAPINLNWGYDNRTVGIRVPQSSPQASRIENRYAGVDCNPYLALAASLACGYLGMREQLQPSEPCQNSSYDGEVVVPRTLADALRLLDDSRALREILGDSFVDAYVAVKTIENDEFNRVISVWEREHLLLNV
jgi:glutamine synthetase